PHILARLLMENLRTPAHQMMLNDLRILVATNPALANETSGVGKEREAKADAALERLLTRLIEKHPSLPEESMTEISAIVRGELSELAQHGKAQARGIAPTSIKPQHQSHPSSQQR